MLADLDRFMIHGVGDNSFIYSKVYSGYTIHTIVNARDINRKGCYSNEAYIIMSEQSIK